MTSEQENGINAMGKTNGNSGDQQSAQYFLIPVMYMTV